MPMKTRRQFRRAGAIFRGMACHALLVTTIALAVPEERHRLYTEPDAASPGGVEGIVAYPAEPIEQILAIPPDEPQLVYAGTLTGADRRQFRFDGLPMRKYDLVVVYKDHFYEGVQLHNEPNTLTQEDLAKIAATIQKAEPFFTGKTIHRVEGTTGRGNLARCICTFVREKGSETIAGGPRKEYRRTFKLVMLKDVGPGWQIVRTRDLYPVWTAPDGAHPVHHYSRVLSKIRVSDTIKKLEPLHLER